MIELEVKAVVPDPAGLRQRLLAAGAVPGFRGLMTDRRFDREQTLRLGDEVLRIRRFERDDGTGHAVVGWKGPVRIEGGYKRRVEHEMATADGVEAEALVGALGYAPVHAIDRRVEYYDFAGAVVRLEWYPRMDCLVEVEGTPEAIERATGATGIERDAFTAEALVAFVGRFEARTGGRAVLSIEGLAGALPSWSEAAER